MAVEFVGGGSILRFTPAIHAAVQSATAEALITSEEKSFNLLAMPVLVILGLTIFFFLGCRSRAPPPTTSSIPPVAVPMNEPLNTPSDLLGSRAFVRDMARLSEHIVMNDVPDDFFNFDSAQPDAAEDLRLRLSCRERPAFFAPDKLGELREKPEAEKANCQVRWQRAFWCVAFKKKYSPSVADWVDTGRDLEKPVLVCLLTPKDSPPIIAVACARKQKRRTLFTP